MVRDGTKDEDKRVMDKAKGRIKEAESSLAGNKNAEGRADQAKGALKEKRGAAKDLLS